jgi:hypothetical protein
LSCIGSVLFGTTKAHLTRRRPRNYLSLRVSQRNDDVIERSADVGFARRLYDNLPLFSGFRRFRILFCHRF